MQPGINRHRRHRLRTGVVALAIAVTAVAFAGCKRGEAGDAKAESTPAPTTVGPENVVVVTQAELASGPAISGNLQAAQEATVRAQIGGTILQTYVDEGTRVSTGTLLARIDDRTIRDQYLSARSAVTSAQSAAEVAQRNLERSERLAAAGAIADRDLETARSQNIAAQSQLADAKARLTLQEKQLADAQIRAPFSGIVSKRQANSGDVVQPGAELFRIVDPTSMRLDASVPASQLSAIKVGAPVSFNVSGYPDRTFEGRITRVNPLADPTTGQVRIAVSLPNTGNNLVGGLFAEGRVASERRNVLVAPTSAVDVTGIKPFVIRLKDGKVERVEVELGLRDEESERVEIKSGLTKGDTLLIGAARGISPGTPVRVSAPADTPVAKS
ncbi:MAG TPA: efflux RND transporter periplasmic adaptor subunit [Gemmatimonadaceae bacterium]|nr:efflux RND transporter periplasmic adaptor subunit [Gemmatimonadaceae bacterium]